MLTRTKTMGTVGYMAGIMALPEPFVYSLVQAIQFTQETLPPGQKIDWVRAQFSLHSAARNELVSKMEGDWLLQLDTDLEFDPDFVARLVTIFERYKLDILTGLYPYKSIPSIPTLYAFNEAIGRHENIGKWDEDSELVEVDSAGAGCLLVRREVYRRIVEELHQPPFEMIPPYGEDHSFFMRARKLGYRAYCAWKVQAKHIGFNPVQFTPDPNLSVSREITWSPDGTRNEGAQLV